MNPGFDPTMTPSGPGHRGGTVGDPGGTAGQSRYWREDSTFAVPGGPSVPGPTPPAPGPALDTWACQVAGYLTYQVCRLAVKYAVDWLPTSWIGDVIGGIAAGIVDLILPDSLVTGPAITSAVFHFVSDYVNANLGNFASYLLDDVLWAKIHCQIYDAIDALPTDLQTALLTAGTAIAALAGYPSGVLTGIQYLLAHLGITTFLNIPTLAFTRTYDCSTCATTGVGPPAQLLQTSFDLIVTDDTNTETFVDAVEFPQAVVTASPTPQRAIVNTKALRVVQTAVDYVMTDLDDVVEADTTSGVVNVTLPPASGTVKLRAIAQATAATGNEVHIGISGGDTIVNTAATESGTLSLQTGYEGYTLINDTATSWRVLFGSPYAMAATGGLSWLEAYWGGNVPPLDLGDDIGNLQGAINSGANKAKYYNSSQVAGTDKDLHLIDAGAGDIDFDLGNAPFTFKEFMIVRLDNSGHTIRATSGSGDTLNGAALPQVILPTQYSWLRVQSDYKVLPGESQANWIITGSGPQAAVTAVTATAPITSSGGDTSDISIANQTANTVLAGPTSGAAAHPDFRAIVATDLAPSPADTNVLEIASGAPIWAPRGAEVFLNEVVVPSGGANVMEIISIGAVYRHLKVRAMIIAPSGLGGALPQLMFGFNGNWGSGHGGHNWANGGFGPGQVTSWRDTTEVGIQVYPGVLYSASDDVMLIEAVVPYAFVGAHNRSIQGTVQRHYATAGADNFVQLFGGRSPETAAVSSIALFGIGFTGGNCFAQDSSMSVYGIY